MELHKIAVRVLFAYVVLLTLMRLSGKRSVSQLGAPAFMVTLILGDLIDDLLWAEVGAGKFAAASGGVVVTSLLVALTTYLSPGAAALLEGRPRLVLREGAPVRAGMRAERVNEKSLAGLLREQGLERERWSDVERAWVEPDGQLSVALREEARPAQRRHRGRLLGEESK
jgi:uncharacterized membrane protein YcaP (DUF421 family)